MMRNEQAEGSTAIAIDSKSQEQPSKAQEIIGDSEVVAGIQGVMQADKKAVAREM